MKPTIEMKNIVKRFPGVLALNDVDLTLYPGEIHAIMGENGAGKSTLIKILSGVYQADEGEIFLNGKKIKPKTTLEAQKIGISTVHQEVNLCSNLSVAENIFVGREPTKFGLINKRKIKSEAKELLLGLNLDIDVTVPVGNYPVAVQQMVAIARAISINSSVLILDEPTSSLDEAETKLLFENLLSLKKQGISIIFISHFIDQIYEICERVTILRNGNFISEEEISNLPRMTLVSKMLGREVGQVIKLEQDNDEIKSSTALLKMDDVSVPGKVNNLNLDIYKGEVLGFAGLLGSGRSEVALTLFGATPAQNGNVYIEGEKVEITSPYVAMKHKIALCPENRRADGIIGDLSVRDNIIFAMQASDGVFSKIPESTQIKIADEFIEKLEIKVSSQAQLVKTLSGGNQQKVILARWLATNPKLLILDEPTRGIDVGTKTQIQNLMINLANEKDLAVVFISSEFEELINTCTRLAVFRDHDKIDEITGNQINMDSIMSSIAGEKNEKLTSKIIKHRLFLPCAALFILLVYNLIFIPGFFSFSIINGQLHGRIIDILSRASSLIIISIGLTFVIGAGGIDISIGSIIAITGSVAAYLIGGDLSGVPNMNFILVILLSLSVGILCGLWNGFLVGVLKIQPIIATLILQTAGRGIAMLITQGQIITVYYKPFSWIGNYFNNFPLPSTFIIAALITILSIIFIKRTSFGMFVQSIGINRQASRFSGIRVTRIIIISYIICGLCASIAGLIEVSMISAADANNAGLNFEANAILAVALGGTQLSGGRFSLAGSIIGAITIQTLTTTLYASGVSSAHLPFVNGAAIVLIMLFQSEKFKELFSSLNKSIARTAHE